MLAHRVAERNDSLERDSTASAVGHSECLLPAEIRAGKGVHGKFPFEFGIAKTARKLKGWITHPAAFFGRTVAVIASNFETDGDAGGITAELERLYQACMPPLIALADRILHNRTDAEDCVHDVILRVCQRPWLYREERSALQTFLAICVQREALARRRRLSRRSKIAERLNPEAQTHEFDVPDFVEIERLRRAVRALPSKQRTALVYAYYRQLSHQEIATSLALPVGTVKSRLSTAIRKLHSELRN